MRIMGQESCYPPPPPTPKKGVEKKVEKQSTSNQRNFSGWLHSLTPQDRAKSLAAQGPHPTVLLTHGGYSGVSRVSFPGVFDEVGG